MQEKEIVGNGVNMKQKFLWICIGGMLRKWDQ